MRPDSPNLISYEEKDRIVKLQSSIKCSKRIVFFSFKIYLFSKNDFRVNRF